MSEDYHPAPIKTVEGEGSSVGVEIVTKLLRVAGDLPDVLWWNPPKQRRARHAHPPGTSSFHSEGTKSSGKHLAQGHQQVNSGDLAGSPGPQSLLHRLMGRETQ